MEGEDHETGAQLFSFQRAYTSNLKLASTALHGFTPPESLFKYVERLEGRELSVSVFRWPLI